VTYAVPPTAAVEANNNVDLSKVQRKLVPFGFSSATASATPAEAAAAAAVEASVVGDVEATVLSLMAAGASNRFMHGGCRNSTRDPRRSIVTLLIASIDQSGGVPIGER
jgi:hypothetical protein